MAKSENKGGENKTQPEYKVVKEFRDRNDFAKVYSEGDDVSHFDSERLEHLVKHGLVEKSSLNNDK